MFGFSNLRWIVCLVIILMVCIIAFNFAYCYSEDKTITCYVLCEPGDYVNVRSAPNKKAESAGYLECGDGFETNAESRNGFIRVLGVGEFDQGWVYSGFVVTEKPEPVFESYYCVAPSRVACRRWCDGPRIDGRAGWLYNGSVVQVFYRAEGWGVTSRGYIRSEWLEAFPE